MSPCKALCDGGAAHLLIPATRSPIAAVLARGPSDRVRLGRWDLERDEYEHSAWLAGTVYPQRCDLSPDGRRFAYFALKPSSTWDAGSTYIAVSRLPWFTALVAWGTDGTWTSGIRFVDDRERWTLPEPAEGDPAPRQPQLRPGGLVRARTRRHARDARGRAVGRLGSVRSPARRHLRWTPAGPRRGGPGFGRVVGGRSFGGRAGPATASPRSAALVKLRDLDYPSRS